MPQPESPTRYLIRLGADDVYVQPPPGEVEGPRETAMLFSDEGWAKRVCRDLNRARTAEGCWHVTPEFQPRALVIGQPTAEQRAKLAEAFAEAGRGAVRLILEQPAPIADQHELEAARATLTALGYSWHGGALWKPPLGLPPDTPWPGASIESLAHIEAAECPAHLEGERPARFRTLINALRALLTLRAGGGQAAGPYRVRWMGPGVWAGIDQELPAALEGRDVLVVPIGAQPAPAASAPDQVEVLQEALEYSRRDTSNALAAYSQLLATRSPRDETAAFAPAVVKDGYHCKCGWKGDYSQLAETAEGMTCPKCGLARDLRSDMDVPSSAPAGEDRGEGEVDEVPSPSAAHYNNPDPSPFMREVSRIIREAGGE